MKSALATSGGIILALLAAVLAPPYWFGVKTEAAFDERLDMLANRNGLQIARRRFERGWFSSRAETVLSLARTPIEIGARHTIHHGPFEFGRWLDGDFNTSPMQARIETRGALKISAQNSLAPTESLAFSVDTTIGLDGAAHARLESPPITHVIGADKLEWQGVHGDIHFDLGARHIRTELRASRFAHVLGEMTDLKFHSDLHEGIAGHYLGKAAFEIGGAAFGPGPSFSLKKLRLAADTSAQGDNLTLGISYDIAEFQAAGSQYGPGRLALELRKLDAAGLMRFREEINALQRSDKPAEQLGLMRMGKLLQLVGELAKKAPELEITELRFHMGDAEISGKAKFVLDGSKANITENPLLMLTVLAGEAELSLPPSAFKPLLLPLIQADLDAYRRRGLLKQGETANLTARQISAIFDQALPLYLSRHEFTRRFVPDGDRYRLTASIRRGQVLVNGEPLNIPGAAMLTQIQ